MKKIILTILGFLVVAYLFLHFPFLWTLAGLFITLMLVCMFTHTGEMNK